MIRPFCWHKNFDPRGLSAPARGYIHVEKHEKKKHVEIVLKLATNGQSEKGFLLTSTCVPKGLPAPALGLYTCIKALTYIPGPGVRWAFTGPLVLWFQILFKYDIKNFWVGQIINDSVGQPETNNFISIGLNIFADITIIILSFRTDRSGQTV